MNTLNKLLLPLFVLLASSPAFAADGLAIENKGMFALGAGVAIGFAALGGGIGQGIAAGNALSGIARNPSASGKVFVPFILGLALIESLVLLAFLIAGGILGPIAG